MYSKGFRRRDSLTRFVSEELGEKGKSPVWMISGSVVFRNALLHGGGSNLPFKLCGL
jgi:hypothetical protein